MTDPAIVPVTGVCSFKYVNDAFWDDIGMFESEVLVPDPKERDPDNPESFVIIREKYEDPECHFIINHDSRTIQVVLSNWLTFCNKCSPCYPNQGNLEEVGGNVWAYDLPMEWKHGH